MSNKEQNLTEFRSIICFFNFSFSRAVTTECYFLEGGVCIFIYSCSDEFRLKSVLIRVDFEGYSKSAFHCVYI